MKFLLVTLAISLGFVPALATEHNIAQAEADAAHVKTLVLNGSSNEAARLLKLAPKLITLTEVVLDGIQNDKTAADLVSSVAACNNARTITFRNCALQALPSSLRMLTQVTAFQSEHTTVTDGEQFYNAVADMPNVRDVSVAGNDFRSLPRSFSRLRTMDNINLVNNDMQLAGGYEANTKTPAELRATETVQFGFGEDVLHLHYTCYNAEAAKAHVQMFRDVLQGAFRQSNVFYTPAREKAFIKKHPLVKPPVAGLDVLPDVFSYNAMTGGTIRYGSGTKLTIPANAFEDANGTAVTGNVDITYREFRDPVDIVLSGIPMTYDTGGVVENFESAGMFEINASQNGNEVFLREGSNIGVEFAVVDTAATFNFYRLDERNGWQYLESTGKTEREMVPATAADKAALSKAVSYYINNIYAVGAPKLTDDTTSFDRRYADTSYVGDQKYENRRNDLYYYREKRKRSCRLYLRKYASGDNYTLVRVHHVKSLGTNPELDAYSGYYWKIEGKQSSAQLRMEYGRKTGINDVRVINENGQFFLEMKYHWGYKRIAAEPVKMDRSKRPVKVNDRMKAHLFKVYNNRLDKRRQKCDKVVAEKVAAHTVLLARAVKDSMTVYEKTIPMMNDTEAVFDFPGWNNHVQAERRRTATAMDRAWMATGNVVQALTISGMGVFNCDQVKRLVQPVKKVATSIKTAAGAVVVPLIVYVIDKARNMVLTYTGNGGGVPITYGGQATNSLMMVDGEGNLYLSNEEQFNEGVRDNSDGSFNGTLISGPDSNPETVRQAVFGPQGQK